MCCRGRATAGSVSKEDVDGHFRQDGNSGAARSAGDGRRQDDGVEEHGYPVVALLTAGVEMDALGIAYEQFPDAERQAMVAASSE
jgi:hypothetical protein